MTEDELSTARKSGSVKIDIIRTFKVLLQRFTTHNCGTRRLGCCFPPFSQEYTLRNWKCESCVALFSSVLVAQDFSAQNSKYSPAIYGDKFTYEEDKFYYFDELEGVLFLKGSIEQGMYKDFRQAISDNKIHTLVLESPGGIVLEGVLIAETVFDRKIKTYIRKNQNCASACAFIFLSGETRYSLGELGVHQISYGDAFSKTKEEVGKIAEAVQTANSAIVQVLEENNTPGFVYKYMFRKTADEMYYFNDDELNQLGNSDVSPQDKLFFNRIDNFSKDYNSHLIKQKCDTDPNSCTSAQLCSRAAKDNMWRTSLDAAKFVKLAKSKGNRCGVPVPVCPEDLKKCNKEFLCKNGTTKIYSGLAWLTNTFAYEAKSRGLRCGVITQDKDKNDKITIIRNIQNQLNTLGCDAGSVDGILGSKTLSALMRWKARGGIYTVNKVDEALLNKRAQKLKEIDKSSLDEAAIKSLLLSHYTFLKRPVLLYKDKLYIGNAKATVAKAKEALDG